MIALIACDPHIWTAAAYCVIGGWLLIVAVYVWWSHPLNRAFLFGPYVTDTGIRFVLSHWPFVFLFGAFIFSCAIDHAAEAIDMARAGVHHQIRALALIEAIISWWTALAMLIPTVRRAWGWMWTNH